MPKEYTHWWLAAESREYLRRSASTTGTGAALLKVLDENPRTFLLGAVGPDFLFYYLSGKELTAFKDAAMVLHGTDGGNTLSPVKRAVIHYGPRIPGAVWAFLFGYACHVAADSVFHPLVLYYVGKGDPGSRYEHFFFESVLDLYIKNSLLTGAPLREELPTTLRELTKNMEMDRGDFLELLGLVSFGGKEYSKEALELCLGRFEFVQAHFWTAFGRAASRLYAFFAPSQAHFEASFYQKKFSAFASNFAGPLAYRNPVTGEEKTRTIPELKDEAARFALRIAGVFDTFVTGGPGGPAGPGALDGLEGPNLETGILGDRADTIVFTAPKRLRSLFENYEGRKHE